MSESPTPTTAPKDKTSVDLEFLLGLVKTASAFKVDYDAAAELMGGDWSKKKLVKKMCAFRKEHDWPIVKNPPATPKRKATKKSADDDGDATETPAKRVKTPKKTAKAKAAAVETSEDEAMEEAGLEEA